MATNLNNIQLASSTGSGGYVTTTTTGGPIGNIVWPSYPGTIVTNATFPPPPVIKKRTRKSVWEKAAIEIAQKNNNARGELYVSIPADDLIEAYGKINPVYRGKPKNLPMMLLSCAAFPQRMGYDMFKMKMQGLVYLTVPVMGKQRRMCRLTANGLKLLTYWSEKYPGFRRFYDAFITKKAVEEIILDSVTFELGGQPGFIQRLSEEHTKRKLAEEEILRQAAMIQQARAHRASAKTMRNAQQYSSAQIASQYNNAIMQVGSGGKTF